MISLSSHILDTHLGKPASDIQVILQHIESNGLKIELAIATTNNDGRISDDDWQLSTPLTAGRYSLTFITQTYFYRQELTAFYPEVVVDFVITDDGHYHIPLLLSAHGYSTYRGS